METTASPTGPDTTIPAIVSHAPAIPNRHAARSGSMHDDIGLRHNAPDMKRRAKQQREQDDERQGGGAGYGEENRRHARIAADGHA